MDECIEALWLSYSAAGNSAQAESLLSKYSTIHKRERGTPEWGMRTYLCNGQSLVHRNSYHTTIDSLGECDFARLDDLAYWVWLVQHGPDCSGSAMIRRPLDLMSQSICRSRECGHKCKSDAQIDAPLLPLAISMLSGEKSPFECTRTVARC